jgi:hypothetical protein
VAHWLVGEERVDLDSKNAAKLYLNGLESTKEVMTSSIRDHDPAPHACQWRIH